MDKLVKKEAIIGACVIIALAILFFGIEYLKGVSVFKPSNYYYAIYTDVNGLTAAAPVTVNGFKVGQVDDVQLMYDNPGHVLVSFSLDKKLRLPVGTSAVIAGDLLGSASVKLEMAQATTYCNPGDTIAGSTSAGIMGEVSDKILPGVGDIIPKVDTLLTSVNNIVAHPTLINTLNRVDAMSASLQSMTSKLDRSVSKMPGVMDDITAITKSIREISDDLNKLSASLAQAPVDSAVNNINRITADLAELTDKLNETNSTLGLLMNDPELYNNLTSVTARLDSLFADIKKNPKRYINIKLL